jgi:protein SCO1/2
VRFDPAQVAAAIEDAGAGRVEQASFTQRLLLLCSHYAPTSGLHNAQAMAAVRVVAMLVLLLLAAWMWRRRRAGGTA